MTSITEVAPDLFKITTYMPEIRLQFSQFVVRDDEPFLMHAGLRHMFPAVRDAVSKVISLSKLRWIGFSHFEADECGALNEWLNVAPHAQAACSFVGAMVSVNDFALRPARGLHSNEVLTTGKRRLRFVATPHLPHCWEAGVFFEETEKVLLCSDLFHQMGDVEAKTTSDVIGRSRETLVEYQRGPFANYLPFTKHTEALMDGLAKLAPRHLATMHGSTFEGDGARALHDLAHVYREVLG